MKFYYKALNKDKIFIEGMIEATSESQLISYLHSEKLTILTLKKRDNLLQKIFSNPFSKVSDSFISHMTAKIGLIMDTNLNLLSALEILSKETSRNQSILQNLYRNYAGGLTFALALQKNIPNLTPLYLALVEAGEKSGNMKEIMKTLYEYLEFQTKTRDLIKKSFIYPAILMSLMAVTVSLTAAFFLPSLEGWYLDFNMQLPFASSLLISFSNIFTNNKILMPLSFLLFIVFIYEFFKSNIGKYWLDSTLLRFPPSANVINNISSMQASLTLGCLLDAKINLNESLGITSEAIDNLVIKNTWKNITREVGKGEDLINALQKQYILPSLFVLTLAQNNSQNNLAQSLLKLSKYYSKEVEASSQALTNMIQPILILVVVVLISFLIYATIFPLFSIIGQI